MWDVILRRWLDLLFWWAPKKEETPRERAPETRPRAAEPSARAAPATPGQRAAGAQGGAPKASAPSAPPAPKTAPGEAPAPAAEPSARLAPEPAATQPEKTVAPPVPDDLTVIKGIGPALQNKLRALGITTFADLAAANPDRLMAQLKGAQPLSRARVQHWTEAARERART